MTNASPEATANEESALDLGILEPALEGRKVLGLRELSPKELVQEYIFTEEIPQGAVVLDCRSGAHYRAWHYPGAERRDPGELMEGFQELDKEETYVLYCSYGVETAYVAEVMQRAGYEAYSFKGGVKKLMEWAKDEGVPVSVSV